MPEVDRTFDTLFVAMCRPTMKFGVPYEGYIANVFGSAAFAIALGAPPWAVVGLIIHFVMREMTKLDHNMFRVWRLWLMTKGRTVADIGAEKVLASLPRRVTRAHEMASSI